jgi:DNA-binding HxlR family transcriptional regulator
VTEPDRRVVQYSLSELGREFIAPLTGMCKWARKHGKDVSAEVHLVEMQHR